MPVIDHGRISFAFHGFHSLSYKEAYRLFLTASVIFYRLWISCNNVFNSLFQCTFVINLLKSVFFNI